MAKYTIAIMDKLLESAGEQSLQDPEVLLKASKDTLFGSELQYIDEKYRDPFAAGFALHFFKDEIGLETWPLWRMSLVEKIVNNYEYINGTYGLLDKQIFANYRMRKVSTDGTHSDTNNTLSTNESLTENEHENKNDVTRLNTSNTTSNSTTTNDLQSTSNTTTSDTQGTEGTQGA